MHRAIDLKTHPDGRRMLSWKDDFPQVPFYKTSLNGTIMIRAGSDVEKLLAGLKTPSAFQEKFEQWLLS